MPGKTKIGWASVRLPDGTVLPGMSWNCWTGCTKISPGCDNCYAETFAERFRGTPGHPYEQGFDLRIFPKRFEIPLHWKKSRGIFVNSMSDWVHEDVPDEAIFAIWRTMLKANWHIYQLLTKRAPRMARLVPALTDLIEEETGKREWPPHIWMGVTVESLQPSGSTEMATACTGCSEASSPMSQQLARSCPRCRRPSKASTG